MNILVDGGEGHVLTQRITPYLNKIGHSIVKYPSNYDIHLAFVRFSCNSNVPRIVRIDGIYYDTDINYNNRNSGISMSHSSAKGIIYQSDFSRMMCERYLSPRKKDTIYSIIHNGIDPMWCGESVEHKAFNIVVSAKWRRHKRLLETINIFLKFNKIIPNSNLLILGKLHDNKEIKHSNIKYFGHLDYIQMKDVFKYSDVSMHLSKKDSCPNTVVETIGAGIPTITTNSCGGAVEMCKLTEGCIIVDGDGSYLDTDPCRPYSDEYNKLSKEVEDNLIEALLKIEKDKRRVIVPEQLTAEYTANKYVELIKSCM